MPCNITTPNVVGCKPCRVNDLLPGQPLATLILYGALMVYLCCGMVTTHVSLQLACLWLWL